MSAIQPRVVLRPRSLTETGDLAFAFIRRHPRAFVSLLPWVLVPLFAEWSFERWTQPSEEIRLLSRALAVAVCFVTSGVYARLCGELLLRPDVDLRTLQRRFLVDLPRWLVVRLSGLAYLGLTFTLGFRSVALLAETVLLERAPIGAGMRRSRALLAHTPGRALAYFFAIGVLILGGTNAVQFGWSSIASLFGFTEPTSPEPSLAPSIPNAIGAALGFAYLSVLEFLLYIDCRTRAEGWDLQVEMASLVEQSAARSSHREAA